VVLAISLWAQLFWYPLATEFLSGEAGLVYVGAYLLPTLALLVAILIDEPVGALFFVPVSFVPGMVLLPEQDVGSLLRLHRSIFVVVTLLGFVGAASLAARGREEHGGDSESVEGETRQIDGLYRHYFTLRLVLLVGLFALLVGAPAFDPALTEAISQTHGEGRVAAQVFIALVGFFVWSVLAYTMFFLPAANLEYDIRRLSREIDALVEDAPSVRRRLVAIGAAGGALVGLAVVWQWFL